MPVSRNSSRMSFSRHACRLSRYSLSPERYSRRETTTSVWSVGSVLSALSKVRSTCTMPACLRVPEPLKMTSIICLPRRLLADCSPSTHLMASTTLDFPQPLGPTMHVTPLPKSNSVLSAKLLKPVAVRRLRIMRKFGLHAGQQLPKTPEIQELTFY